MAYPRFLRARTYKQGFHSGAIAFANVTQADLCTDADVTLPAQVGDTLMCWIVTRVTDTGANDLFLDVISRVSSAGVTKLSSQLPATPGWAAAGGSTQSIGAPYPFIVGAPDISGGKVTLRMQAVTVSGSPTRNVANPMLMVWNVGPAAS